MILFTSGTIAKTKKEQPILWCQRGQQKKASDQKYNGATNQNKKQAQP